MALTFCGNVRASMNDWYSKRWISINIFYLATTWLKILSSLN